MTYSSSGHRTCAAESVRARARGGEDELGGELRSVSSSGADRPLPFHPFFLLPSFLASLAPTPSLSPLTGSVFSLFSAQTSEPPSCRSTALDLSPIPASEARAHSGGSPSPFPLQSWSGTPCAPCSVKVRTHPQSFLIATSLGPAYFLFFLSPDSPTPLSPIPALALDLPGRPH